MVLENNQNITYIEGQKTHRTSLESINYSVFVTFYCKAIPYWSVNPQLELNFLILKPIRTSRLQTLGTGTGYIAKLSSSPSFSLVELALSSFPAAYCQLAPRMNIATTTGCLVTTQSSGSCMKTGCKALVKSPNFSQGLLETVITFNSQWTKITDICF